MLAEVAWALYTMYHSLWASTVDELEALTEAGDYEAANRLLGHILAALCASDDGRFGR